MSNISLNQSQFSGPQDLKQNLDVLYQGYLSPSNLTGFASTGYQMAVPDQTFWQGHTTSSWATSNVAQAQPSISSINNTPTQTSLVGMKPDIFPSNLIKKQNNNNLIDLNFFDSIESPKENFSNVRTSVLEAFDPLLYGQTNTSTSVKVDQGIFFLINNNY